MTSMKLNATLAVLHLGYAAQASTAGMAQVFAFLAVTCFVFFITEANSTPAFALRRSRSHARRR